MFWRKGNPNPFDFTKPVTEPDQFLGREQLVRSIMGYLRVGQSVSIQGPPKIGKTSLLHYVSRPEVLQAHGLDPERFLFTFIDCQKLADRDRPRIFREIGRQIYLQMKQQTGIALEYGRDFQTLSAQAKAIKNGQLSLVLLFDQFDQMGQNNKITHDFLINLRALANSTATFLIASEQNLAEMEVTQFGNNESNGSPFANIFISSQLEPLSIPESQTLLREKFQQLGDSFPQPNEDDLRRMTTSSQSKVREPYRLQWLGHQLVTHAYRYAEPALDLFGEPLGPYLRQRPYLSLDGVERGVKKRPLWELILQIYPVAVAIVSLMFILLMLVAWWPAGEETGQGVAVAFAALLLFTWSDSRPVRFSQDQISWSFLFIFVFLLLENMADEPSVRVWQAVLILILGSVGSELLRQQQAPLSKQRSLIRLFFYSGHHALVGIVAARVYLWTLGWENYRVFLQNAHLPLLPVELLIFAAVYMIMSYGLMWPYDRAIFSLLGDTTETPLPRLNLATLIVTLPLPLAVSFAVENQFSWWMLLLVGLFALFLYFIRAYPQIEQEAIGQRHLNLLRQKVEFVPDMNALGNNIRQVLDDEAVPYCWGAVYSYREAVAEGAVPAYYLRNVLEKGDNGSQIVNYDPRWSEKGELVPVSGKRPFSQTIHWPKVIATNEPSQVSQLLRTSGSALIVRGDGTIEDADSAPYLPPQTFALYVPTRGAADYPNGLLMLAAPTRFDQVVEQRVEALANVVYEKLEQIRPFEAQLHKLFADAEDYTPDQDKFYRTVERLRAKEVDVFLLLDLIMEETFRRDVLDVMRDFTQPTGPTPPNRIQMSPATLREIYQKALRQKPDMPPLDDTLLAALQELPTSLTVAFSFRYRWPRVSRSSEYEPIYAFLVAAMETRHIEGVADLRQRGEPTATIAQLQENAFPHQEILTQLKRVEALIKLFGNVSQDSLISEIAQEKVRVRQLVDPERFLFSALLDHWHQLVFRPIAEQKESSARSDANLTVQLRHRRALPLVPVTIGLRIKNIGDGAAFQLSVEMLSTDAGKPSGKSTLVERWLPPQQSVDLNFLLTTHQKPLSTLPVTFQISYQDRLARIKKFEDTVQLAPTVSSYSLFENPYSPGAALERGSQIFVGREDVAAFINETVGSRHARQRVLLLTGERRIGKTSLLKHLPILVKDYRYIHVFFDCQMLSGYLDEGMFCRRLAQAIETAVYEAGFTLPPLPQEAWASDPFTVFEHQFLNQIWQTIGEYMLLISIDEFDRLDHLVAVDTKISSIDLALPLRGLMQSQPRITFVFSSKNQLEEIDPGWSQILNMGQRKNISFLHQEETRKLAVEPVKSFMTYDELSLDEIYCSTAGHPYFTQLICDKLVNICAEQRRSYVTVYDVHRALANIVAERPNHLTDLWLDFDRREQDVLGALVKAQLDQRPTTVATVAAILEENGREYPVTAVRAALKYLQQTKQIVNRQDIYGTGHYTFTMKLYHQWIQQYHTLD